MRRLGIFLFFDRDGKVSDHVIRLLAGFSEHVERLLVISNGPFYPGQVERISSYVDQVIVRPNIDFDVGGYRDGIRAVGFNNLSKYDEVVLFNYTVFGPIFDLREMFDEMSRRDIDFWGLTEFSDRNKQFLQSYFLVTRNRLHSSSDFREYWLNMPEINSVEDSIHFHEFRFTPFFVERGYKKGVFIENEETWQGNTTLVDLPGLIAKRTPLIKYRAFNFDPLAIERRGGMPAAHNFEYIRDHTGYPVDLIWSYILSQGSSDQIIDAITGTRITSDFKKNEAAPKDSTDLNEAVLFLSVEEEAAVEDIRDYFAGLVSARFYIASTNPTIVEYFSKLGWSARQTERPMTGVPIAAFANEIHSIVGENDVVFNLSCFVEERGDYRFRQWLKESYWEPLVSSAKTVREIRRQFEENFRIGLLFPPSDSVFGRIRRSEPLCSMASNWIFETYPDDVKQAPGQSRWPWRGNAALSGRLARSEGFVARLAELTEQMKVRNGQKLCGPEGFMAELARRAGYASGLVTSAKQAAKLVTRHSAQEQAVKRKATEQAERYSQEMGELRAELELVKASKGTA